MIVLRLMFIYLRLRLAMAWAIAVAVLPGLIVLCICPIVLWSLFTWHLVMPLFVASVALLHLCGRS